MIVSDAVYMGFVSVLTGGVCAWWLVVDSIRLARALRDDTRDPAVRDRVFGSLIGLAIYVIGVYGVLNHHGWL